MRNAQNTLISLHEFAIFDLAVIANYVRMRLLRCTSFFLISKKAFIVLARDILRKIRPRFPK